MRAKLAKLRTLVRLGVANLARVGLYRVRLKWCRHPVQKISASPVMGPFFTMPELRGGPKSRSDWQSGHMTYFGRDVPIGDIPHWHIGPENGTPADHDAPWWTIPDFDAAVGDIKTVWEASRFDWLIPLAQRAVVGDADSLATLNHWITDWSAKNPPYLGANWKCGQEASIRVIHLAAAALVMQPHGKAALPPALRTFLHQHLQRIAPTMGYAIGQANNHGTSEAAALFIGGTWTGGETGNRHAALGRKWLEDRARKLVMPDGSFSQYSVTYHRVMLDTYSLAEIWCRQSGGKPFSAELQDKLRAATLWLAQMTDPHTGDAPVIGANDGAHLIRLTDADYRDFRPSVQLATALFCNATRYRAGAQDDQLAWLGLGLPAASCAPLGQQTFADGGFQVLRCGPATAYLRFPRFRFRPSQADALHCDFWLSGRNILRDAGSFSYNVSDEDTAYFNGTASHNTVQFDGRDQMPRLSRFLFGDWLKTDSFGTGNGHVTAAYTDSHGAHHSRTMTLGAHHLDVTDKLAGFTTATLRWRLIPANWVLTGNTLTGHGITLTINGDVEISLTQGWESRYYLQKKPLPVLEVTTSTAQTITTKVSW
jgi:hypothetical protein